MLGIFILIAHAVLVLSACPNDSLDVGGRLSCNKPKYMTDNLICTEECPTRFSDEYTCPSCYKYCDGPDPSNTILFTLEFSGFQDFTLDRIQDPSGTEFLNPGGISFNDPSQNSPLPTLDRGFYFAPTSGMSSSTSFIPGLYFILNLWIKALDGGEILNVLIDPISYIRISSVLGLYQFDALIKGSDGSQYSVSEMSGNSYSSSWHYVSIYFSQDNCNTASFSIDADGGTDYSTSWADSEMSFPSGTYNWNLGSTSTYNSFKGFIYWLQTRVDNEVNSPTSAPTVDCADKQYWDGTNCNDCNNSCPNWPWCIRSDCSICYSPDCSSCTGYSFATCSACTTGVLPLCCDHLATECTQTWTSTLCNFGLPSAGVCLYGTPYGAWDCGGYYCFTVLTADFNTPFAGAYGSEFITGSSSSSYNYWNSPEASDPLPAKNRGLYFDSNRVLSGSINLSNTWSIGIWAYVISGVLISAGSNKLNFRTIGAIDFDLETWDGTKVSYTVSNPLALKTWSYISCSVGFANKSTTITPYLNMIPGTALTVANSVFRFPDGGKLYIGSGLPKFKGFISYFQLWGETITDFSTPYNLYGFTGGVVSTLWPCEYSYYYDGSNCQPCLGSCTMGCTRGTSCYICDDILCAKCLSFLPNSCTLCISNASGPPCQCNPGFYQPANQALCSPCHTKCASCVGSLDTLCTSCNSGYFLYINKVCLLNCPTGYIENFSTKICTFSSATGLSLSLYDQIKLDSVSGVQVGPTSNVYPTYETGDPYPQYLQGYYFKSSSYMLTNTVIGPYFTISIWVFPTSSGPIVSKIVSGVQIFCLELNGGFPKLSLSLSDSSSFSVLSSQNILISSWSFVSFTGKIDSSSTVTINSYFNSISTGSGSSSTQTYFQDLNTGTLYIGNAGTSGFEGFLYNLKIFNSASYYINDYKTSSCTSPCTQCPSDYNCPKTCPFLEFYNVSACESCAGSCTNGCRYSSSTGTCTLCKTLQCYVCDSFSGSCSSCITNAENDGSGGCKCKTNTFWKPGNCEVCDVLCSLCKQASYFECSSCTTGSQMVNDICLNDCPYGYGAACTVVSTAVIDLLFDTDFQGSYGIFTSGSSSSTYQHFVSPEAVDPVPAYKRGLYFDGSMHLESSLPVPLSHSFSMGTWNWDLTADTIISKNQLQIISDGSMRVKLVDNMQVESVISLTQSTLLLAWNYISAVVAYTSSTTIFEIYINGNLVDSLSSPNLIFRDQSSTNLKLGKYSSSGFVGFLYSFQLWNVRISDFLSILNGFSFCGAGLKSSCLSTCSYSAYQDGASCLSCSSCTKGCVRGNSCNICYDILCLVCSGFGAGKCTQCISSANLVSGSCFCNPGYGASVDGLSCALCPSECSLCTISIYNKCTACISGFFLFASTGQCLSECPSGYIKNSITNACDYVSNIGINLDLTDQIRLDTVSGFNIGIYNANTYPNFDVNDPIPAYKRGYYFKFSKYLSSTVMIAPSFTVSIWTKPLSGGILVTKYFSSDIFKITVDPSGFPVLSIKFCDSTSTTLTASTSILNSWHFLSFTGQVQSDGKTIINLYINAVSTNSITTTSLTYFKDTTLGYLYIGNDETFGTSGLHGFLARLIIYNSYSNQADDYATSSCVTGCSACPSNHLCLSECDFDKYPDSCIACSSCSQGCVNGLSCNLCRDKECESCTNFSGECTSCIANAYKSAGHCMCLAIALWVPNFQSCELCHSICASCSTLKFNGCLTCISGYYLIQSLCMSFCPTGYTVNGSNCNANPAYTNFFVFNLMPHQIKDVVTDLKSNIPVLTGKDNSFYPDYDATDPIATINRGYYFTGSSYMQLPPYAGTTTPLFTFAPKFTIAAWIKPIIGTGVIFSKQANSGLFKKSISLELINKYLSLTLTLKDSSTITYTSSNPSLETTLSQWNFISAISSISSTPQQTITLSLNGASDLSSDLAPSWLIDLENSFLIAIGACYSSPTSLISFFNGFLWDLKIYNTPIAVSSLASSSCNWCSICPIDNGNACIDPCGLDKYLDGSICVACSLGCSTNGCVRSDKSCNLCKDVICKVCDDYTNTCITCKTNANLVGTSCQCNSGYYWNTINEDCELCDISCKTCTSSSSLDCLSCADGYYSSLGVCKVECPVGYSSSPSGCVLAKEKIFDLDLNTLNGVIYDKASSIPVITGSSEQFYPDYEADDPIPAYLRGFYFNGQSSVLRLPEYSTYTSPNLLIGTTFTISIWINTEISSSALLSKHDITNNFSVIYSILLIGSKPAISLIINSSPFILQCQTLLNNYEWSHIAFTLEPNSGYNIMSSYIDGLSDSSATTGYGAFTDTVSHTTITIGAQLSSQGLYNYYQGFIYSIQMFNIIKPISSLSTKLCNENCNVCPTNQICIPNCKINEYWNGPAYNKCYNCNNKCKKSCRDWRDTCSLCSNLLCEDCVGYSSAECLTCTENAINPDSCICDDNHVLGTPNNTTCITIAQGGFRGPDGVFYPCPNLCTLCESSTKCTACVENASLKTDLCYCNLGYNGIKACALVPFSAKLAVLFDNSLSLTFSESLAKVLTVYDFIVVIEKQGEIACKIEQVNSTFYYISLNIKEKISKGTLATFTFLDLKEVKSVSNGILNSSDFTVILNSYDPDPYSSDVEAVTSQATAITQTTVAAGLALSFISPNPSSLWSIMNTLQILSYLTLSGIPFSSKIRAFLNNLNSFNLFPNMFSYLIDEKEGNTPYSQAQDFGYETDLILINQGNDFTLILASIVALPLIYYFSKCSQRWIGSKLRKTLKSYQFAFYLRFWIQCYLELGAAVSIGIIELKFINATQIINFIICASVCILLIITPGLFFRFSYKNKNQILLHQKTFFASFGSLFYEFRTDQEFLTTQYYFVFFLRRLIYIVNLVYLRNYPETEVTINIVLSLMTIMHLLLYSPFKDQISQLSNLVSEILICIIMGSTAAYLFNLESNVISKIENCIVIIIVIIIGVQLLASITIFVRTIYDFFRAKFNTGNIDKVKILPIHSQIVQKVKKADQKIIL
ncbi:unnamed protein product [Blepharisma stoltei]|uniref:TNFR-Cys domain-containing protein n=1 Tax=Blepharisma stoltei TaxID=1481888 RepID=A0AAU9KD26_9CILI|nr:unnamed protein product [Blepharisma stoltei]